jgi:sugar/nucleoside kinase (ribokinase family)
VRVVAVVGSDFPQGELDLLAKRGVDLAGVERQPGKTFRWAGRYAENLASRTTLDTQLNVFADFKPRLPESYRNAPYVLLGNIQPQLQLEVLDQVRSPKLVAADTMNFWISGERAALGKVLERVDLLVINDEELRQLAGEHNIRRAAKAVLSMGPKRLVVKRGEFGALLFDDGGVFFAPAYPLETEIDPTGAGDSFAGALLGFLASQRTLDTAALRRALMAATTVASFCVEGVGTRRTRSLSLADVSARLEELRAIIQVPS